MSKTITGGVMQTNDQEKWSKAIAESDRKDAIIQQLVGALEEGKGLILYFNLYAAADRIVNPVVKRIDDALKAAKEAGNE